MRRPPIPNETTDDDADVRDLRWSDVREDWEPDGGLRDICVFDTTIEDWQRLRDLVASRWTYTYRYSQEEVPLPESMQELFEREERTGVGSDWNVRPREGMEILCHFFERDMIELDIDPADVTGQRDLNLVCEFVRAIGSTLEKPVVVAWEGAANSADIDRVMEYAIMRYEPASDTIVRVPPPDSTPKHLFDIWDEDRRRSK